MKKQYKKEGTEPNNAEKNRKRLFPVGRATAFRRLGRKKGLMAGKVNSPMLEWLVRRLDLEPRLAAAYAALFAEALDHRGQAEIDIVAERHGLKGESRLSFIAAVEKLLEAGLILKGERQPKPALLGTMLNLDSVVFMEVLHGAESDAGVDYSDAMAVIGEAERLLPLSSCREISRKTYFSRLSRLAAKSADRNILGQWLEGLPPVELALFFTAAAMAGANGRPYDVDDFFNDCQLSAEEKGRWLRLFNKGGALVRKRRLVKFGRSPVTECLSFYLSRRTVNRLYPELRNPGSAREEGEGKVTGLQPCPERRSELFLVPGLAGELASLENACTPAGFEIFQRELGKAGLPQGLTILMHGAPGTGKTAAAFTLARAARRPVLQVDMSQVRDKYVGESEKHVKAVFDRWRAFRKGKEPEPLLLLNEADALVGRRVAVGHSVDQMHNVMQNVLLEELERFDGILVATTNLLDNIDSAFDRRFLCKLRFDPPGEAERRLIWRSRMPELPDRWAERLAARPLTGAQIENVARRAAMQRALKKRLNLAVLEELAAAEGTFRREKTKVSGFAPQDASGREAS